MTNNTSVRPGLSRPPVGPRVPIDDNTSAASSLPIKDEAELAIEARAQQLAAEYDMSWDEALQQARGEMMESMDAPPAPPSAEDRLAKQHQATGIPEDRARRLARGQVQTYGEQGAQGFADENDSPEGRERLARAWEETQAADARHQRMYDDYFRGSASPTHWSVPPEEAKRDEYNERKRGLHQSYLRDGLHPQQVVDPVDPNFVSRGQQEEADRKAERDAHMEGVFKNIRQKYGSDEESASRAAYAEGKIHVPQTPDQRSLNEARRNLEIDAMKGSDDARQKLRAMEAGVNYDDLTPEERDALRAPGGNMSDTRRNNMMSRLRVQAGVAGTPDAEGKSADQLRELIAAKRADEAKSREAMWRPRLMMQRGNAVGALAVPGINEWQQAFIAGGPTPLAVDAVGAQNALRMMNAEALAGMDPARRDMQREVMEQRRQQQEATLPADQKIALSRSRREPMGSGLSAGPVQAAWNGAMTEAGFRRQMEGHGYSPAEIDDWIDARRNIDDKPSGLAAGPAIAGQGGHAGSGEMFGPGGGL